MTAAAAHALTLRPVNPDVFGVYLHGGLHVGNLKRVGALWKFKAVGYDAQGHVLPGHGPLTNAHNTEFAAPDASAISLRLCPFIPKETP